MDLWENAERDLDDVWPGQPGWYLNPLYRRKNGFDAHGYGESHDNHDHERGQPKWTLPFVPSLLFHLNTFYLRGTKTVTSILTLAVALRTAEKEIDMTHATFGIAARQVRIHPIENHTVVGD